MNIQRRNFIGGMIGLVAAPAIVRVANIMPISVPKRFRVAPGVYPSWEYSEHFSNEDAFLEAIKNVADIYAKNIMDRGYPELETYVRSRF